MHDNNIVEATVKWTCTCIVLRLSDTEKIITTIHQICVYTTVLVVYHKYIQKLVFLFLFGLV